MRFNEFLLEYNRNITAQKIGDELLMALKHDDGFLEQYIDGIKYQLAKYVRNINELNKIIPEETRTEWKNHILSAIEQLDPTPQNKYTPWLARMYAKAGGGLRMEDINRMNLVGLFDLAKKKNKLKPEHKDINSFKWYSDFEDVAEHHYNFFSFLIDDQVQDGQGKKVFEDDEVLVVVPLDEAGACKYGRQTRWCTAATQGKNYFNDYNSKGPLYILIPKNPEYEGEKYQLHFETDSFMDEGDEEVNLRELLTERFPSLDAFFKDKTKERVTQDNWHTRFYEYGVLHKEDGPAVIANDGSEERWFKHGSLHREDGPAVILYDQNGEPKSLAWLFNGVRHRLDGPAYIQGNGNKEWWVNGHKYRESDYDNLIKVLKKAGKI